MGLLGKIVVYGGFFALGFGVCYGSCVNKHYSVIEENGQIYVEDNKTGRRSHVDDDFDATPRRENQPVPRRPLTSEEIGQDLKRRVNEAYDSLAR